ncbi:MAG: VWA domain-containing protein [Pyrinomonadaceae bacterium]|nr:VWA domain-containing protein [Pyrinomonadaceae bacterium]MBP6212066.1 VWA domain-containing protein [Pyrinomonadaceae bacterium]
MKNIAAVITILGTLVVGALGQSSTASRPRVASTPTPPVLGNNPNSRPKNDGPPVLVGGSRTPAPSPTETPDIFDESEVIKVETNLVTMPVSVLDRDGRFISGLKQQDFKIFENGVEQKVDFFQSVEQPFTVILLIDVSPSTQFRIEEIQNAAITFVDKLRPADRVMVIAFDQNVNVLSPATNNRYQLRNAIRQAQFGDGTGLYEAVDYAINQELRNIQGRKAVVLFSDGVDTTSRSASYQSTIKETEEVDALFYTIRYDTSGDMGGGWGGGNNYPQPPIRRGGGRISMGDILGAILSGGNVNIGPGGGGGRRGGGRGNTGGEYDTGRKYLEALATTSGGRTFEASSMVNIDAAFSGIAEELRRQYSLGYYPDNVGKVGDRKQIKIRVMRPEVVVRAKNSYIVGQTDRTLAGR